MFPGILTILAVRNVLFAAFLCAMAIPLALAIVYFSEHNEELNGL